ncbi:flagellar biosynthesis protein FlhB [Fodinisporobacter ferrooxydans]|uniref:Flagellar biosynthetic protein FlhB n=1 Tax=Fodinisporobacter ferrooxydans TaxID=2901836 RepID=A0ABY4CIW1_9BACL|nr:flagellar biosynthesis protein FlhB [Alicyclobacillaceae bacterium MYW30-H2]
MNWHLQQFAGEKTEKATPKRRQEARDKGQIPRSQDLNQAVGLLLAIIGLKIFAFDMFGHITEWLKNRLGYVYHTDLTALDLQNLFIQSSKAMAVVVLPILAILFIGGMAVSYYQLRGFFSLQLLVPDFNRLNPISGIRKFFSLRSTLEAVKALLKIVIIAGIPYSSFQSAASHFSEWADISPIDMISVIGNLTYQIVLKIAVVLLILSIFDYIYQKYEFEKSIRMSKQDIKDERKNAEGDPAIKQKIRQRGYQLVLRRMMQEVPKADVVITNPTHFAVALQYEAGMHAPVVLAKGVDELAQRMKQIARDHDVAIVENRLLARTIYHTVELGQEIPGELFQAVAEVLAYVYRLRKKA